MMQMVTLLVVVGLVATIAEGSCPLSGGGQNGGCQSGAGQSGVSWGGSGQNGVSWSGAGSNGVGSTGSGSSGSGSSGSSSCSSCSEGASQQGRSLGISRNLELGISRNLELGSSVSGLKDLAVEAAHTKVQKEAEIGHHIINRVESLGQHSPREVVIERVVEIESKPRLVQIERSSGCCGSSSSGSGHSGSHTIQIQREGGCCGSSSSGSSNSGSHTIQIQRERGSSQIVRNGLSGSRTINLIREGAAGVSSGSSGSRRVIVVPVASGVQLSKTRVVSSKPCSGTNKNCGRSNKNDSDSSDSDDSDSDDSSS